MTYRPVGRQRFLCMYLTVVNRFVRKAADRDAVRTALTRFCFSIGSKHRDWKDEQDARLSLWNDLREVHERYLELFVPLVMELFYTPASVTAQDAVNMGAAGLGMLMLPVAESPSTYVN